jgi:hypothetical protein
MAPAVCARIKRAVWHAVELSKISDGDQFLALFKGPADEQLQQRYYQIPAALLTSAAIHRREGSTEESGNLILDAMDWLPGPNCKTWIDQAVDQLWKNYWLTADPKTREQLGDLYTRFADLGTTPAWQINQACEKCLQGSAESSRPLTEEGVCEPTHLNLLRLTQAANDIRSKRGFIYPSQCGDKPAIRDAIGESALSLGVRPEAAPGQYFQ